MKSLVRGNGALRTVFQEINLPSFKDFAYLRSQTHAHPPATHMNQWCIFELKKIVIFNITIVCSNARAHIYIDETLINSVDVHGSWLYSSPEGIEVKERIKVNFLNSEGGRAIVNIGFMYLEEINSAIDNPQPQIPAVENEEKGRVKGLVIDF